MDWQDYIISDHEIMFEKPVIRGIQIPVVFVLEKMAFGQTIKMRLKSYS